MFPIILRRLALSVPLLGERVGVRRWLAVGAGFLGVLLILRPGAGSLEAASLVALSGAFLYALVMIQLRRLNRTERPTAIVFYYVVTSVAVSGLLLPLFWTQPSPRDWLLLLALGIVGGLAQLALTTALRHAEAQLGTLREVAGWCNRGAGVWAEDQDGLRHGVDCKDVDAQEAAVRKEKKRLEAYLEEGLEDECRRAGCLPGWLR